MDKGQLGFQIDDVNDYVDVSDDHVRVSTITIGSDLMKHFQERKAA